MEFAYSQDTQDFKLVDRTHYFPIINDYLFRKVELIQLCADSTRGVIYSLSASGKVEAFRVGRKDQFEQIKSSVNDPEIKFIQPVPSEMSYNLALASATGSGSVSFYSLNDSELV